MRLYSISNEYLEVVFTDYGGRIVEINSKFCPYNLVLSYRHATDDDGNFGGENGYLSDEFYLGAIVGRYANRIKNGCFTINGEAYSVHQNENKNCLHSGKECYAYRTFKVDCSSSTAILALKDESKYFPGNVDIKVKYSIIGSSLMIQYTAKPNIPTPISLTNHSYFSPNGSIDDCIARFYASAYTPTDSENIPYGTILPVHNTPFDFTYPKRIGDSINSDDILPVNAKGFDHNFVIDGDGLRLAGSIFMPVNNITLNITTSAPGFQFYTGNYLEGDFSLREGFAFETQYFPDSPNNPDFPSCIFTPDNPFKSKTIYSFQPGNTIEQ